MSQSTTNLLDKVGLIKPLADFASALLKRLTAPSDYSRNKINWRVDFLRFGLGFIYLWFGVLKFFPDLSSAEKLAGTTIELMTFGYLTPQISLPLLALWETSIGLALLTGKFQRAAIFSLYFHIAGTLLPLILLPNETWNIPLVAASLEGQYIFKNLITIGAILVINGMGGCRKHCS